MARLSGTTPTRGQADRPKATARKATARSGLRGGTERGLREIPQRELRNEISRVLGEVAAGARFVVTVRGQPVAELSPVTRRRMWVPWREVVAMLEGGRSDDRLLADVDEAVDQTVEDPWTRYSTPRSS